MTRFFSRYWSHFALIPASLGFLVLVVLVGDAKEQRAEEPAADQAVKRDGKEATKMVEAIANRNKQPKIIKRRRVKPSRFPLFPKDYDWKEEERVRRALERLAQDTSVEIWEALVQKANDKRYCIASYSGSSDDVEMHSVGGICSELAYYRLCKVFTKHLPSYPPHGSPIQMWGVINDFPTWRKARKDKSLYQLQIEVCEIALRELPKLMDDELSDKGKAEARKKIQNEIAELKRTKRPIFERNWYPVAYPRREAQRVREAYEKGTLEKLEISLSK